MTLKRVMLPVLALVLLMGAAPFARADDVPGTCADNFSSGTPCQGPDSDPKSNNCKINTWVVKASCVLRVPGGVTNSWRANVLKITSESDQTPAFDVKLIVPSTGEVLDESSHVGPGEPGEICTPGFAVACAPGPFNELGWSGTTAYNGLPQRTTDTVICEITSTWTKYGELFAPAAEANAAAAVVLPFPPATYWPANNYFGCEALA